MKGPRLNRLIAPHDYRQALKDAVSWLGDRYLLATPSRRISDDRKSFYNEPRDWHATLRPPGFG